MVGDLVGEEEMGRRHRRSSEQAPPLPVSSMLTHQAASRASSERKRVPSRLTLLGSTSWIRGSLAFDTPMVVSTRARGWVSTSTEEEGGDRSQGWVEAAAEAAPMARVLA